METKFHFTAPLDCHVQLATVKISQSNKSSIVISMQGVPGFCYAVIFFTMKMIAELALLPWIGEEIGVEN
jgi:hypothetical protein